MSIEFNGLMVLSDNTKKTIHYTEITLAMCLFCRGLNLPLSPLSLGRAAAQSSMRRAERGVKCDKNSEIQAFLREI